MKTLLLVGGLGTRLHSILGSQPKAMAPVSGRPFLEYQIELLRAQGIREFVLCVGHLRESIMAHFGDGADQDVHIEYSIEQEPLGTAGALRNAARFIKSTFLLMNGDTYLDIDYQSLMGCHPEYPDVSVIGTIGVVQLANCARVFGVIEWDLETGRVKAFQEKKACAIGGGWVSAGVYVLEPSILQYIPVDQPVSLEEQVFPSLQYHGALRARALAGTFVDIGTPEGYRTLNVILARSNSER